MSSYRGRTRPRDGIRSFIAYRLGTIARVRFGPSTSRLGRGTRRLEMGTRNTVAGQPVGLARGSQRRRLWRAIAALLGVALLAVPAQVFAAGRYPNAMASTGDSVTRAYNT